MELQLQRTLVRGRPGTSTMFGLVWFGIDLLLKRTARQWFGFTVADPNTFIRFGPLNVRQHLSIVVQLELADHVVRPVLPSC